MTSARGAVLVAAVLFLACGGGGGDPGYHGPFREVMVGKDLGVAYDTGKDKPAAGDAGKDAAPDADGADPQDAEDAPVPSDATGPDVTADASEADAWPLGDDDGDGIPNGVEGEVDTDGDGTPDFLDQDSDADGIPDKVEGVSDPDYDGKPSYKDPDSDDDGLDDAAEALGKDGVAGTGDETSTTKKDTDDDGFIDLVEVAYGSDPLDPASVVPPDVFYLVLPYDGESQKRHLDFSTDITRADVLILVDLSGSMGGEHANLKKGIKQTVIGGIKASVPEVAFGLVKFGTLEDDVYAVAQAITTDADAVKAAVDGISECGGSEEAHSEVLYQAAAGTGFDGTLCTEWGPFGLFCIDESSPHIPPASCPAGKVGGACFRPDALPIFLMMTDEPFQDGDWDWESGNPHDKGDAIAAMKAIGAKFVGVDSSEGGNVLDNFKDVSKGTGSLDKQGNPFNYTIAADGTGLSQQVVDAVVALTENSVLDDVTTQRESVANPEMIDTTQFVKSVTPVSASPAGGVESMDATSFHKVDPGTTVTFDVEFRNDFYEPTTVKVMLFQAVIHVVTGNTLLSSRPVYIIVPGNRVHWQ
ncbi:MAG: VWA domain-containing protein [Deltaproteobacteria bacterium]|nr:VWA domain-containing protein [Deltaproteobacteria bacterium]